MLDSGLRRFRADHPRCAAVPGRARGSLFGGVPMPWMMRGRAAFRSVESAPARASLTSTATSASTSAGDTGAMAGHSPGRCAGRCRRRRGVTTMMPTEDAAWVGGGARPALRAAALAVHADRDRRQPHGAAHRAPDHRAAEGARLLLLLPRLGRRGVPITGPDGGRSRERATSAPGRSRSRRPRRVQRPRGAGGERCAKERSRACSPSRR